MAQINKGVSIPQVVGSYLKRELKRRGTTQEAFSYDFGVDVRTVRRWVRDGVHSLDVVVEIARYFGVSVGDVLSDEDGVPYLFAKKQNLPVNKKFFGRFLISGQFVSFFYFKRVL